MKENIKLTASLIGGAIGAAIPVYAAYSFWSWSMSQVPAAYEWAGPIKVALTLMMIPVCGGLTFLFAFLAGIAAAGVVAWLTGLLD